MRTFMKAATSGDNSEWDRARTMPHYNASRWEGGAGGGWRAPHKFLCSQRCREAGMWDGAALLVQPTQATRAAGAHCPFLTLARPLTCYSMPALSLHSGAHFGQWAR